MNVTSGRRLIAILQLPPPVHGVTAMNEAVLTSPRLRQVFELSVLPLRFADNVADIGLPSLKKGLRFLRTLATLLRHCVFSKPDLAYLTLSPVGYAFYRDVLLVGLLKLFRVALVLHLHGKGIQKAARGRLRRHLYGLCFRNTVVIHLSPTLYRDIASFVPENRCLFLSNAVPEPRIPLFERGHAESHPPHILFLSTMMIEKGPLVLLQALTMLQSRSIPFSATFAGPWYRDSCRDQFNTLVAQEGLQQSVRYLGPQFGHAKESLFAEADIFAFPTYYSAESFPLVILEAMSSGLPVLSTPEGAITEIVVDGVTGLLAPQRDPDQLAANLEHLIMNPLERVRMGRNGRQRYLDNYTIARFHERVVQQLDTAWRLHRHNHRPSKAP